MMLYLQDVAYRHPNRDMLFADINLTVNKQDKVALIGNNGTGKSTLLKILSGDLIPSAGSIKTDTPPYYVPQLLGQFNEYTVAQALRIEDKLNALQEILKGRVTDANLALLDDDWGIEERCAEAFSHWQLGDVDLSQKMSTLSGGQKTKVLLAGIDIHDPEIVLLDEPSNHLDGHSRDLLYRYIVSTNHTLVVVSHDRTLLNLLDTMCDLHKQGITIYGGNYDFYAEQKRIEDAALQQDLQSREKALRKARETERATLERQQKLDARGKKKQEKAGLPTISMNTFRNNAEKSTARIKGAHTEKVAAIAGDLSQLRKELPGTDKMKMGFDDSLLHKGKVLINARELNFGYGGSMLWREALNFDIASGERLALKGSNGSGKTTVIRLILGELRPSLGAMRRAEMEAIYIDQDYSLIDGEYSVYEQAQKFNSGALQEHEIKIRLARFLFTKEHWDKPGKALSGGERMRLVLCCLTISQRAPDMIILDEPTNNLDIRNIEILTAAIKAYKGTLIVVSHDNYFLEQIDVERCLAIG